MNGHAQEGAVQHSGIVEHHHRWVDGDGSASTGGTPRSAAPAYPAGGWRGNYILFPWDWMWGVLVFGVVLAALAAAAYGIFSWIDGDSKPKGGTPGGMTMAQILRGSGFRPSHHAVCSIGEVANGTAYRLTLNRGAACRQTVEVVLPAEKVQLVKSGLTRRANATWVFKDPKAKVAAVRIKRLALGEQLKVRTRHVIVRLKPTDYQRLRTRPAS